MVVRFHLVARTQKEMDHPTVSHPEQEILWFLVVRERKIFFLG